MVCWRDKARRIEGEALPCVHSDEEEVPELFLERVTKFLG